MDDETDQADQHHHDPGQAIDENRMGQGSRGHPRWLNGSGLHRSTTAGVTNDVSAEHRAPTPGMHCAPSSIKTGR